MSMLLLENQAPGAIKAAEDGSYEVVLISPGRGTSGLYTEELIEAYAPAAWPKGTHVYLDHLKKGETRSPEKLLGSLTEDTTIADDGSARNRFKPLTKHAQWIEEVRAFVGLSISAKGDGNKQMIDGEEVLVVESLDPSITNTVDVVSYAGRGGRFLESLYEEAMAESDESAHTETSAGTARKGNANMTVEEQLTALTRLVEGVVADVAKVKESIAAPEAADETPDVDADRAAAVEATLAVESAEVTASVKESLIAGIKAGKFDVAEALAADAAYREEVAAEVAATLEEAGASANGANSTKIDTVEGW